MLSDIGEPELVCPACSEVATAQFAIFSYLPLGGDSILPPSSPSAFGKPLIKLAKTNNLNYAISKLVRVMLCHKLILTWKFSPDYRSQLNRQQRPAPYKEVVTLAKAHSSKLSPTKVISFGAVPKFVH
jgi:hypothetical protein